MDRCRCGDIPPIERDIKRIHDMESQLSDMHTALDDTDRDLQKLKDVVARGAEVSLAGVASDAFSQQGREQMNAARSSMSARIDYLNEMRENYIAEDRRYHKRIADEALQRQREHEEKRRASQGQVS